MALQLHQGDGIVLIAIAIGLRAYANGANSFREVSRRPVVVTDFVHATSALSFKKARR